MSSKSLNIFYYNPQYSREVNSTLLTSLPSSLDSWVRETEPELYPRINWVDIETTESSQEKIVDLCNTKEVDILCITAFVWSIADIKVILHGIRSLLKNSNTIIVLGGPEVGKTSRIRLLTESPEIDFAVFGQGENAFIGILKHALSIRRINLLNTKNIAWIDDDGIPQVSDFEFIRRDISPYIGTEHLYKMQQEKYPDTRYSVSYELSKGCVYKCAFCDWQGGGLTYKMHNRTGTFKDELDMFASLGAFVICLYDSNLGMFPQHLEFADYLVESKKENGWPWELAQHNFAKLHKVNVFKIIKMLVTNGILTVFRVSAQSMDPTVLDNAGRPDVPWDEHKGFIIDLMKDIPPELNINLTTELIYSMPGNTRPIYINSLRECATIGSLISPFKFDVLENSIAFEKEWQDKFAVKTEFVSNNSLPAIKAIVESYSFNKIDFAFFTTVSEYYISLSTGHKLPPDELVQMIDLVLLVNAEKIYEDLTVNMDDKGYHDRVRAAAQFLIKLVITNFKNLPVSKKIIRGLLKSQPR